MLRSFQPDYNRTTRSIACNLDSHQPSPGPSASLSRPTGEGRGEGHSSSSPARQSLGEGESSINLRFTILIPTLTFFLATTLSSASDATNLFSTPKFLGAQSCSSSSCHGGASEHSNEYTIWSTRDFHHERPYATLTTARSERIADVLKIGAATQSPRCTTCHAPFQTVPSERIAPEARVTEGVSCESCHGPAENWLRSHTRKDYTHADRVASGMRDLKNLHVRANTCVACHQNLDPDIRAAGHPELIFELDGQSADMPRHWREDNSSFKLWSLGTLVALREMSWQLSLQSTPDPDLTNRWVALVWLIHDGRPADTNVLKPTTENFERTREKMTSWLNHTASTNMQSRRDEHVSKSIPPLLEMLLDTSESFNDNSISKTIQARKAEQLVIAFDRMVANRAVLVSNQKVNQSLNRLFDQVQSLPDFDPTQFAKELKEFEASVKNVMELQ